MRRLLASTVARLVASVFVLQLAVMLAAILLLRAQMSEVIDSDRARQIVDVRDDLLAAYYDGGREGLTRFVAQHRGSIADPLVFVAVQPPGGAPPTLDDIADLPVLETTGRVVPLEIRQPGIDAPLPAVAMAGLLPDGTRMIVGALTAPDRRVDIAFAEAFTLTLVLATLLSLGGALAIGYVVSNKTHAIADTAAALGAGNFTARVEGADTEDGFDHLRRQINLMAERIDTLVGALRSVSGALAHDLRSPVARLRASLDTAQQAVPDGAGAEALALARADAEALDAMLAAALDLARLESGTLLDRRLPLDLLETAADLVELYEPLAEQSDVALSLDGEPATVLADRELISRALANLIDNALKYGGHSVRVTVSGSADEVYLDVADDGPGIDSEDRARAVERFTRLDSARTRSGAGLGLAMVAAVARLHGGRLVLGEPADGPGLLARMAFPRA